jgi:CheY-like chemotaxis protein
MPSVHSSLGGRVAKILIVDDNTDESQTLARLLEARGHETLTASNGRDALAYVIGHKMPDVILLDLFMPQMDGQNFLEVLRSYLRVQALPVVVLTGVPDSPMVDHVRALKVNTILSKGTATPDVIIAALEQAVGTVPG